VIKKKAESKATTKKRAAKKSLPKNKEMNPAEVRKDIAQLVDSQAKNMAQAVINGVKGQLATLKYLFEVAEIYPPSADGSHVSEDEDCLAQTLLRRMNLPDEPIARDDEDSPKAATPAEERTAKPAGEDEGKDSDSEVEAGEENGIDAEVSGSKSA
jgi:hypothetical protein